VYLCIRTTHTRCVLEWNGIRALLYFMIAPLLRQETRRKRITIPPRQDRGECDETYCNETLTRLRHKRNTADLNLSMRARVRYRNSIRQIDRIGDAYPIGCRFFDDIPEHVCMCADETAAWASFSQMLYPTVYRFAFRSTLR